MTTTTNAGYYITIDETGELHVHDWTHKLTLKEMQDAVSGGLPGHHLIELFDRTDGTIDCYCNEEGRLNGMRRGVYWPEGLCFIHGPVLVTGHTEDGEVAPLTAEQVKQVRVCRTEAYVRPERDPSGEVGAEDADPVLTEISVFHVAAAGAV